MTTDSLYVPMPKPIPDKLPADLDPGAVIVVVDTREQTPFYLKPLQTSEATLATGDYSLLGLESHVCIERKSLPDLLACIGNERERFERELQRMLAYPVRAVIVECSWADLEQGAWRSQLKPAAVVNSVLGWMAMGVPFCLPGDRAKAQQCAGRMLVHHRAAQVA